MIAQLRRWWRRTVNLLRPGHAEPELDREIASHLAMLADDFEHRGMTPDEARLAARRGFGGVEQTKETHRDARSFVWLDDARRDLRYAIRSLRRTPGFTIVAVVTLALGIGAVTAIFSVVHAVLLQPLPFPHADGLVQLYENVPAAESPNHQALRVRGMDMRELLELRTRSRTLSQVVSHSLVLASTVGSAETTLLSGEAVSEGTFPMLGTPPILGRWFSSAEDRSGRDKVIVLSDATWRRYFNGDPSAVGKTMTFTGNSSFIGGLALGEPYTVIGVMPRGFRFPDDNAQFWVPLELIAPTDNRPHRTPMMGRLADGVSRETALAELSAILHGLRGDASTPRAGASGPPRFELNRVQDEVTAPVRPALMVLSVTVGFVLLIACANVANLLLARTAARQREIAVRIAIGAGRWRLIRQALTESLVLALLGGAAGTALAFGGVHAFRALAANLSRFDLQAAGVTFPRLDEVGVNGLALAFAFCVSAASGLLFGLAPALRHSRTDHMDALRESTSSTVGRGGQGSRRAQCVLVVGEIAIATLLFIGGSLLMRSFVKLASIDPGYDAPNALTFQVALRGDRYPAARLKTFADELVARLGSVPGVQAAAYARQLPFVGLQNSFAFRSAPQPPEGFPDGASIDSRFVSPDYLQAMGIRVIAGRGFEKSDRAAHPRAMLINQTLADRDFSGGNPVGRQVYAGPDPIPWEIVGIVADVRQFGLDREPQAQAFVDLRQWPVRWDRILFPIGPYFAVRMRGDRPSIVTSALAIARQLDPEAALYNVATMEEIVSNSMTLPRMYAALLGVFAAVAVGLAAIGIYGMMAYSVTQRTREIGIRMALGAQRATVLGLVIRQSAVLTGVGIVLGLAGAVAMTRYLESLLFGLTPLDPSTFLVVSIAFAGVATLASYVPAHRATRVDPLVALRHE
jgi:predicted permease